MNPITGQPNFGSVFAQCVPVGGYIVGATRQEGSGRNVRTVPMGSGALSDTYFEDEIEYTLMIELPEGPTYFERVRTSVVLWKPLGVKVKPLPAGTPVFGVRIGQVLSVQLIHTPDAGECP